MVDYEKRLQRIENTVDNLKLYMQYLYEDVESLSHLINKQGQEDYSLALESIKYRLWENSVQLKALNNLRK